MKSRPFDKPTPLIKAAPRILCTLEIAACQGNCVPWLLLWLSGQCRLVQRPHCSCRSAPSLALPHPFPIYRDREGEREWVGRRVPHYRMTQLN